MTAVDEYRKFTFGVSQNTDAGRVTKKADVAIAALEADCKRWEGAARHIEAQAAALEAELEHQTEARKRHAALEREAVLAAGKAIKRAEAAEAALARDEWYRTNKPHALEDYRLTIDRLYDEKKAAEAHNKTLASEYGHMTEMFKQSQAEVARLRQENDRLFVSLKGKHVREQLHRALQAIDEMSREAGDE